MSTQVADTKPAAPPWGNRFDLSEDELRALSADQIGDYIRAKQEYLSGAKPTEIKPEDIGLVSQAKETEIPKEKPPEVKAEPAPTVPPSPFLSVDDRHTYRTADEARQAWLQMQDENRRLQDQLASRPTEPPPKPIVEPQPEPEPEVLQLDDKQFQELWEEKGMVPAVEEVISRHLQPFLGAIEFLGRLMELHADDFMMDQIKAQTYAQLDAEFEKKGLAGFWDHESDVGKQFSRTFNQIDAEYRESTGQGLREWANYGHSGAVRALRHVLQIMDAAKTGEVPPPPPPTVLVPAAPGPQPGVVAMTPEKLEEMQRNVVEAAIRNLRASSSAVTTGVSARTGPTEEAPPDVNKNSEAWREWAKRQPQFQNLSLNMLPSRQD